MRYFNRWLFYFFSQCSTNPSDIRYHNNNLETVDFKAAVATLQMTNSYSFTRVSWSFFFFLFSRRWRLQLLLFRDRRRTRRAFDDKRQFHYSRSVSTTRESLRSHHTCIRYSANTRNSSSYIYLRSGDWIALMCNRGKLHRLSTFKHFVFLYTGQAD